jgi:hypothetical protein
MRFANQKPIDEFFETNEIRYAHGLWNHLTWAIMGLRQWKAWQTQLLAEPNKLSVKRFISETARPAIRLRIREFAFVGLQEEFDRSLAALCDSLGASQPVKSRRDHSLDGLMKSDPHFKKRLKRQRMSRQLKESLDGLVQLDEVVYDEARKYFAVLCNAPRSRNAE